MKKVHLFILLLFFSCLAIQAQRPEPVNPQKDKKQVQGLTVQLRPAPGNTYLFSMLKEDGTPIPYPPFNPVTRRPDGFQTKEDAYKIAGWLIKEYKKTGRVPRRIPLPVAEALNVTVTPLDKKPK